jgi:hypothetical protein
MKSKRKLVSAMGGIFALTAFTPLVSHGFGDGKCGSTMMKHEMVDANDDGMVSKDEMMTHIGKIYENMDTNDDGEVSRLEWLFAGHAEYDQS